MSFRSLLPRAGSARAALAVAVALVAGLALPSGAAPPATPPFSTAVDPYSPYQGQSTCASEPTPGILALRDLVRSAYPTYTADGHLLRACTAGRSEHKDGRAWDWMVDARVPEQKAVADELLAWLTATDSEGNKHARFRRLGIMYVIWNGKVFESYAASKGWQTYTGADPHTDHVHFSLGWAGARMETSWWREVGAPVTPALTAVADGQHGDVLMAGPNLAGQPTTRTWSASRGAGPLEQLGGQSPDPAGLAQRTDGTLVAAVRGTNGALYVKHRPVGGEWSSWLNLGGGLSAGPSMVATPTGGLEVVVRGTNAALYTRSWDQAGGWSPWARVPGPDVSAHGPAVAVDGSGVVSVVAVGLDGAVWRTTRSSGTWGARQSLGGATAADLAAVSTAPGQLTVVLRGTNDAGYVRTLGSDGDTGWLRLGGVLASGPGAAVTPDGVQVAVWGSNGRLYRSAGSGRTWSSWSPLT